MKKERLIIYPDDVVVLTGKSVKYCRNLLSELKESLGKDPKQHITCCELGAYLNIEPEVIYKSINNLPLLAE
tara:strand:- start:344 stop:559 length:216 start_codon:yes stop_codon:yes gene_type:complete